ncbi:MAG: hypothetical protein ACRDM1_07660 [Gaiellaceae bacterium]
MKKPIVFAAAVLTLALAGTAAAALVPGVYDPGNTGCPTASYSDGVLHLAKNCPDATNAAAFGEITGFDGQAFDSGSFTLASAAQCQGGSPRFNVLTSDSTFFLGCNNVTPTTNGDGTVTYSFDRSTIAAAGGQVPFPTGTIQSLAVLIDIQGSADVSSITVNGAVQVPTPTTSGTPTSKSDCKHGGWKTFTSPSFKNQGRCVSYAAHHTAHGKSGDHGKNAVAHGKSGK